MTEAAKTRRSYDVVADRYAAEISGELTNKPLDRAVLDAFAELTRGGAVADVGCGPAHVAAYLSRRGVLPTGLDLSPGMCAAGRRATSVPLVAGDMTALPIRTGAMAGLVCLYAVIHLDAARRARAYEEFARVLRGGGHALLAFHVSDPEVATGSARTLGDWWGSEVDLTFRFLDPAEETAALRAAGLHVVARLDRDPHAGIEHPSRRCHLLARRP